VGDLEVPPTAKGDFFQLGFYGFLEDVLIPAGRVRAEGTWGFPNANGTMRAPSALRIVRAWRNEDGDVYRTRDQRVVLKRNGTWRTSFGVPRMSVPEGHSLHVWAVVLGRNLRAGMVLDGWMNYTPHGQEQKTYTPSPSQNPSPNPSPDPEPNPTPTDPPPPVREFANCTAMRDAGWTRGVNRNGGTYKAEWNSAERRTYPLNTKSDRDSDGHACET
jgi:hypothetical protein